MTKSEKEYYGGRSLTWAKIWFWITISGFTLNLAAVIICISTENKSSHILWDGLCACICGLCAWFNANTVEKIEEAKGLHQSK